MKKTILLVLILCLTGIGCNYWQPGKEPEYVSYNYFTDYDGQLGTALVTFPRAREITPAAASASSDVYEILVFNHQMGNNPLLKSYPAVPGESLCIYLPVDTYKIAVLAGIKYRKSDTVTENIMLGTGYADDVVISSNAVTNVAITLRDIDMQLTAPPGPLYCGVASYDWTFSGSIHNPFLEFTATYFQGFNQQQESVFMGVGNGYSGDKGAWCFQGITFDPAPSLPDTYDLYLITEWLILTDYEYCIMDDINFFTTGTWKFPYSSALYGGQIPPVPFEEEVHWQFQFIMPSNLNIDINW